MQIDSELRKQCPPGLLQLVVVVDGPVEQVLASHSDTIPLVFPRISGLGAEDVLLRDAGLGFEGAIPLPREEEPVHPLIVEPQHQAVTLREEAAEMIAGFG